MSWLDRQRHSTSGLLRPPLRPVRFTPLSLVHGGGGGGGGAVFGVDFSSAPAGPLVGSSIGTATWQAFSTDTQPSVADGELGVATSGTWGALFDRGTKAVDLTAKFILAAGDTFELYINVTSDFSQYFFLSLGNNSVLGRSRNSSGYTDTTATATISPGPHVLRIIMNNDDTFIGYVDGVEAISGTAAHPTTGTLVGFDAFTTGTKVNYFGDTSQASMNTVLVNDPMSGHSQGAVVGSPYESFGVQQYQSTGGVKFYSTSPDGSISGSSALLFDHGAAVTHFKFEFDMTYHDAQYFKVLLNSVSAANWGSQGNSQATGFEVDIANKRATVQVDSSTITLSALNATGTDHWSIECNQGVVTVSINGAVAASYSGDPVKGSRCGLRVSPYQSSNMDIVFDEFEVTILGS